MTHTIQLSCRGEKNNINFIWDNSTVLKMGLLGWESDSAPAKWGKRREANLTMDDWWLKPRRPVTSHLPIRVLKWGPPAYNKNNFTFQLTILLPKIMVIRKKTFTCNYNSIIIEEDMGFSFPTCFTWLFPVIFHNHGHPTMNIKPTPAVFIINVHMLLFNRRDNVPEDWLSYVMTGWSKVLPGAFFPFSPLCSQTLATF